MISKAKYKKYIEYLNSQEWKSLRLRIIRERGYKCERCPFKSLNTKGLQLHHKTYRNLFNEKDEDLEVLCAACHKTHHSKQSGNKKISKPGDLIRKAKRNKALRDLGKRDQKWLKSINTPRFDSFRVIL